ncbi:MAG TPA: rubrerythrin family protein [Bacteroidota bacterium]|mgnify:FL=1|nr:rubrerythrin family protein [Candidatus Kapabacteria bacterium]HRS01365.1 rubrerythrin family protein [Bacteroidota bacterium]HRT68124.1 rubrerythrin family protein [Bacteroidota bacterium]
MDKTLNNLRTAIIGETTASQKYAAFSQKAKQEGYLKIAILFEAVSQSEAIHAANHKRVLEYLLKEKVEIEPNKFEVKSTAENLQNAIEGETYEVETMYPEFIEIAKQEEVKRAVGTFSDALASERKHKPIYENALAILKANNESTMPSKYYICPACGFTYDEYDVKDVCEVCGVKKEKFLEFQL